MGAAAYGYWHAQTHATFEVRLMYRNAPYMSQRMRNGQLSFHDDQGAMLARASIDTRRGVVWIAHPVRGQCGPQLDRDAHQECFRALAGWIPQWAHRVRFANVTIEDCTLARIPVNLYTRRDNTVVWWTPLAHRRGQPYTRHSATLMLWQPCG